MLNAECQVLLPGCCFKMDGHLNFADKRTTMLTDKLRGVVTVFALLATSVVAQTNPTVQERLGYPATARLLVIHADDLGMNHSVNRAIFEALDKRWVTSASILVSSLPVVPRGRALCQKPS